MEFTVENLEREKPSLNAILSGNLDEITVNEDEAAARTASQVDGMCIECGDQPAVVYCEQCADVCFTHQHRKGTRTKHSVKKLKGTDPVADATVPSTAQGLKATIFRTFNLGGTAAPPQPVSQTPDQDMDGDDEKLLATDFVASQLPSLNAQASQGGSFLERSKFIPLRLTYEERKFLRLLEAGLGVSEYTDKIDILSSYMSSKSKRIVVQIKELCSILSGLVLAADYNVGQALFKDRDFENNAEFFQDIFELGRRHKIMNPEKMRNTYGKLVYMLQDSQIAEVQEMLGFKCVKPIRTVYGVLEAHNALALLDDPLIEAATAEILDEGRSRRDIQADIKKKERAIEYFAKRYGKTKEFNPDTVRQCLYSIGDNNSFLR
ncbi:hypothetical protein HDU91_006029 [Kappamyces sp. JEL0680]|nr:hypothetical protein HDU91_006029 [Kappamyces sp. JEL0680]